MRGGGLLGNPPVLGIASSPLTPSTSCTAGAQELRRGSEIFVVSQLKPKSHNQILTKAITDSSCEPPPQKKRVRDKAHVQAAHTAASTAHTCLSSGNCSLNEAPAAHYPPQGLSHIRGCLGTHIFGCKVFTVVGAAAGLCSEQTGMIHTPVS